MREDLIFNDGCCGFPSGGGSPASTKREGGCPPLQPSVCGHTFRGGTSALHQITFSLKKKNLGCSLIFFPLQVGSTGIEAAWAGGIRGREVTDRFLPAVAQLLSSNGLFYLITIAENDPGESLSLTQFKARKLFPRLSSLVYVFPLCLRRGDHPFARLPRSDGRGCPLETSGE